jgi:hypothetical protein
MRARLIDWRVGNAVIHSDKLVGQHVCLDFFAADVGQHLAIDFNAWTEHLAALLDHFLALHGIVDDVAILVRKVIFFQYGANSVAPAATRFELRDYFRFVHKKSRRKTATAHFNFKV